MSCLSHMPNAPARTLRDKSRLEITLRDARVGLAQARRLLRWGFDDAAGRRSGRLPLPDEGFSACHYNVRVPIGRTDSAADPHFEAGKTLNLKLAAPAFDGLVFEPGRELSFWRVLGRITAARGYTAGMSLAGGCVVPALGGGICLLSNALFVMAATLGWRIHERYGHSVEVLPFIAGPAGSSEAVPWGLDATVFWPHIDLRVEPIAPVQLTVRVEGDALRLTVMGAQPRASRCVLTAEDDRISAQNGVRFRHNRLIRRTLNTTTGRLIQVECIGDNSKELRHRSDWGRSCLTCNETRCHTGNRARAIS